MWQIIVPICVLIVIAIPVVIIYLKNKKNAEEKYGGFDFKTKYGMKVWLTPKSREAGLNAKQFEEWTDSVVSFWEEKKGWSKEKSIEIMGTIMVRLKDEFRFMTPYYPDPKNGLALLWDYTIEASVITEDGNFSLARIASLFRHETSHFIAYRVGGLGNLKALNEEHHALFKEVGLGA